MSPRSLYNFRAASRAPASSGVGPLGTAVSQSHPRSQAPPSPSGFSGLSALLWVARANALHFALQGTNQQIKAHEASSAVQHVNLLKEWSNSLEKKVGHPRAAGPLRALLRFMGGTFSVVIRCLRVKEAAPRWSSSFSAHSLAVKVFALVNRTCAVLFKNQVVILALLWTGTTTHADLPLL